MSIPVWPPAPDRIDAIPFDARLKFPPDYCPFGYAAPVPVKPHVEYREPVDGTWRGLGNGLKLGDESDG